MPTSRERVREWIRLHTTDAFYVRLIYYYTFLRGRRVPELLNLRNPKTWNEKINFIKLHIDRVVPDAHLYADKLRVRDYVVEAIGEDHVVPLLGSWEHPEQIVWANMPDSFVLKANHGSGFNLIVQDRSTLDVVSVTEQMNIWLETDYSSMAGEKHYRRIPRRLLAEELMVSASGDLPDYRCYCFDGAVGFISINVDRATDHRRSYVDSDWNPMPFEMDKPRPDRELERPAVLNQVVSVAESLAAPFFFVRVDLYEARGSVFFSELTFVPAGGMHMVSPRVWNRKLGELIRLPEG